MPNDVSFADWVESLDPAPALDGTGAAVIIQGGVPVRVRWGGFARKAADEAVTASATLQDDDDLVLPLEANASYAFDAFFIYDGATGGDLKVAFTVPAGATLAWSGYGQSTGATIASGVINTFALTSSGSAAGVGAIGAGQKLTVRPQGIVRTGATAGNLQVQWAQNASDPTATTMFTDSWLRAQRVA
jgi:hypothetical protein